MLTDNSGTLRRLTLTRPTCPPAHADGTVAVVPDIECLEWNALLRAVASHELSSVGEDWNEQVLGSGATLVDDDGDGGGVVHEVLGQGGHCHLDRVALDDLAEDLGDLTGFIVRHACFKGGRGAGDEAAGGVDGASCGCGAGGAVNDGLRGCRRLNERCGSAFALDGGQRLQGRSSKLGAIAETRTATEFRMSTEARPVRSSKAAGGKERRSRCDSGNKMHRS